MHRSDVFYIRIHANTLIIRSFIFILCSLSVSFIFSRIFFVFSAIITEILLDWIASICQAGRKTNNKKFDGICYAVGTTLDNDRDKRFTSKENDNRRFILYFCNEIFQHSLIWNFSFSPPKFEPSLKQNFSLIPWILSKVCCVYFKTRLE